MVSGTPFFTTELLPCDFLGSREIMPCFQLFWTVGFFAKHHLPKHTILCVMNPFDSLGKPGASFFRITFFNAKNRTYRITKETKYHPTKNTSKYQKQAHINTCASFAFTFLCASFITGLITRVISKYLGHK